MEEKELEKLVYANVDFANLDEEHVYVFKVKQSYVDTLSQDEVLGLGRYIDEMLTGLNIKHVVIIGDSIEITELISK